MQIGLRAANQQFSRLMKAVRGGKEVVLTERGRPLAVIRPIRGGSDEAAAIERLEASGVLRPAVKRATLPAWTARPIQGPPLSDTIRHERDES